MIHTIEFLWIDIFPKYHLAITFLLNTQWIIDTIFRSHSHRSVRLWVIHSFLNNPLLGFPEIYSTPVVYVPYTLASGSWCLILQYLILLHSVHSYMSFVRNTQNVYGINAVRLLFLFYLVLEYFKYTNFSVSVFLNLLLLTEFALNIKQFI